MEEKGGRKESIKGRKGIIRNYVKGKRKRKMKGGKRE